MLVTLAMILLGNTTKLERVFSAMNFLKNLSQNHMGNQLLNDSFIVYVEENMFVVMIMRLFFNIFNI